MDINKIVDKFTFSGVYKSSEHFNSGHINDTFLITCIKNDGAFQRYILQRINKDVFKEPEEVMKNIAAVTSHLRKKILQHGGNPARETLNLIKTTDGGIYHKSSSGDYWRAYDFIENARSYIAVRKPQHFYSAGRIIGKFQRMLADFPLSQLYETIRDFHNTPQRFDDFIKSVKKDEASRAESVAGEIDFVRKRSIEMSVLENLKKENKLPLRVTHNDTKFNNVLLDEKTGKGLCLVDLDTVMPGLSLYDFGDAVRTGTSNAVEDEKDLTKVQFNLKLFYEFSRGYLEETSLVLNREEKDHLAFSARLMTLECGMRFLKDYIDGDIYFKTTRESHNLQRARNQFKLLEDMESQYDKMLDIVHKHIVTA